MIDRDTPYGNYDELDRAQAEYPDEGDYLAQLDRAYDASRDALLDLD